MENSRAGPNSPVHDDSDDSYYNSSNGGDDDNYTNTMYLQVGVFSVNCHPAITLLDLVMNQLYLAKIIQIHT